MHIYIITGASKGIGFELMNQIKERGEKVIGIARTNPTNAESFLTADLADTGVLTELLENVIEENVDQAESFTLINNAGTVEPIGLVGNVEASAVTQAVGVNLIAPMILSNTFINKLKEFQGTKRIINISSGAGRNPYEGWGVYCTTKAGLDHFTRVISLEQQKAVFPVDVMSIAPGIIDTDMQEKIRSSDSDNFPLLDRFIEYKEHGQLSSAKETTKKLIAILDRGDFKKIGPIADIRQM